MPVWLPVTLPELKKSKKRNQMPPAMNNIYYSMLLKINLVVLNANITFQILVSGIPIDCNNLK
jgi:hypothetical protein